ncbi:MAG TPA: tRNA dihydrouridine(16) synthase DusC, partial [Thiolinea sp.]|nr:tRNA dihydrouridine(16) synthase DusC [Thiolinea sp.]
MEGVLDAAMRALLTRIGGYDRCVTEFVRITNQQLPARVFQRHCPELL